MFRGNTQTVLDRASAGGSSLSDHKRAKVGHFIETWTPWGMVSFVTMLYKQFGGYVPMAVLTYCFNEGFAFPTASMATKLYFLDVVGLDGPNSARHTLLLKVGWIAKPFVGMLSDVLPLFGFRRSSYLALSCIGGIIAWTTLAVWGMPAKATLPFLVLAGLSLSIPDVMIDATTAELVKKAPEQASNTQALNQVAFAIGGLMACSISGYLIQNLGPRPAFMALNLSLVILLIATLMRCLPEERLKRAGVGIDFKWLRQNGRLAGLATCMSVAAVVLMVLQVFVKRSIARFEIACTFVVIVPVAFYAALRNISSTLSKAALFIFLHGCLQPNYPDTMFHWMRKAKHGPHFNVVTLGWTECFGSVGLMAGVFIYTKFLTKHTYRFIFTIAILATVIPSIFDLALVKRWNLVLHIPDIAMAIGDESFQNCVIRLFRMPVAVLAMKACPKGTEGSVMSLILSLGGFGHALGVLFGSCLLEALDVKRGHYEHLPEALAVRGLCRLLPLIFLPLLIPAGLSPSCPVLSGFDLEEGNGEEKEENNDDAACSPERGLPPEENENAEMSELDHTAAAKKFKARPNPNAGTRFERGTSAESDVSTGFDRRISTGSDASTTPGFGGSFSIENANSDGFHRLVSTSSVAPSEFEVHHDLTEAHSEEPHSEQPATTESNDGSVGQAEVEDRETVVNKV